MKELDELKKEREEANTALFKECGLFFAFSQSQFDESKTPLKDGEKYISIGGGGYVPKSNLDKLLNGMETNQTIYDIAVKANNLRYKEIAYEFANHECYYTGDWQVVADMFPHISPLVIERIYYIEYKKHIQWLKDNNNY